MELKVFKNYQHVNQEDLKQYVTKTLHLEVILKLKLDKYLK